MNIGLVVLLIVLVAYWSCFLDPWLPANGSIPPAASFSYSYCSLVPPAKGPVTPGTSSSPQ